MQENIKENFEALPENMQKYYNYKEQMGRLKKALGSGFYLEAVFIEYAMMEDRLKSFLKTAGAYNEKKHWNIQGKLKSLKALAARDGHPIGRYLTEEILEQITEWKDKRNPYIHELMKAHLTTDGLRGFAEEGRELVKLLNSKSSLYRKYTERRAIHE